MSKDKCQGFIRYVIHYSDISTVYIIFLMLKNSLMARYDSHKTLGARKICCNWLFLCI